MKILKTIWSWIAGDPRDWAPSNANFLGFALPALAGIAGSLFKKKSQDKAAQQAYQQQQQQQQYEMQQRLAQLNAYNQQRQQQVGGRRDLLKAYLTSKGLNTNPFFEHLGGFEQFFSRPISGLQDPSQLQAAPIFKPQTSSWWDVGGQALGAAGGALGNYFGGREQNKQLNAAAQRYGYNPQQVADARSLGIPLGAPQQNYGGGGGGVSAPSNPWGSGPLGGGGNFGGQMSLQAGVNAGAPSDNWWER
jgi:hypothetical protein